MAKTVSEKVSEWITEQLALGKTHDQLDKTMFVDGTTVSKITKSGKKFTVHTQFDCIDISDK